MKHLSLARKLFVGFAVIMILSVVISIISLISLFGSNANFTRYRQIARNTNLAGKIQANMLDTRMNVKNYLITPDTDHENKIREAMKNSEKFVKLAKEQINNTERARRVSEIEKSFFRYRTTFNEVTTVTEQHHHLLNDILNHEGPMIEKGLTGIMHAAHDKSNSTVTYYSGTALRSLLLARLYLMKYLNTGINDDMKRVEIELTNLNNQIVTLGEHITNDESKRVLQNVTERNNTYVDAFRRIVAASEQRTIMVKETLDKIGPEIAMTTEEIKQEYMSEQDNLGPKAVAANNRSILSTIIVCIIALLLGTLIAILTTRGINTALKRIINQLRSGAEQVASASEQLSSSSQSMSDGASEQASSIEEVSSSLEEMSSMTKQNADNSQQSKVMSDDACMEAQKGKNAMDKMNDAIGNIKKSADETAKIIKTIDEIAMQTNLLALNAAVEAARAGEAGRGFAVVAEEVRNLAQRSADAAKSTADLIEDSQKNADNGVAVSQEVNETLGVIVGKIEKASELISEVSGASKEQAQGIEQVNTAVAQMDQITQQNASNAEESASASEELSGQAQNLNLMVSALVNVVEGGTTGETAYGYTKNKIPHITGTEPSQTRRIQKSNTRTRSMSVDNNPEEKEIGPEVLIPLHDDRELQTF